MKRHNKFLSILLIAALALLLAACEEPIVPPTTAEQSQTLTAEQAQQLALAHAGFQMNEVSLLRTKFEIDDSVPEYEIDFQKGDYEYDYTVHAETGKILKSDKEYGPAPTSAPAAAAPAQISSAEAEKIALKHAGLSASDVRMERTEYDLDDGVPVYEIEFRHGKWEYSYEIHAETGKILDWEKDD